MANPYTLTPTAAAIYKAWQKRGQSERPRTYLGASIVGHHCDFYLWLYFRGVVREDFDGRMYRLFDRGKREEAVFVSDLRSIGCEVKEFDEDGNQFGVDDFGGHFSGHLDGVCKGLAESPSKWHVVEFKTHSDSSFKTLCKQGVTKAKPTHFVQMTVYMGKTGLEDALYVAVNKDNDELYTERLKFDKAAYDSIMERAKHIIDTTSPEKCSKRPDDFRCKACPCHDMCWDESTIVNTKTPFTCRTCCHATADTEHDGAQWVCALGHSCSTEREACDDFLLLPSLVHGTIVDGSADAIRYLDAPSGNEFTIRKGTDDARMFKEVAASQCSSLDDLKAMFPEAKVIDSNALELKFSKPPFCEVFSGTVADMKKWMGETPAYEDWSKPKHTETFETKRYFEYADTLVVVEGDHGKILTSNPPF